ncbi:MAG TPA: DUF4394 domain-containing protein [Blastocatellia bacterium]
MKKSLVTLTFTALALSAMAIPGFMRRSSASAEGKLNSSQTSMAPDTSAAAQDATFAAQDSGVVMPKVGIYALDQNNTLFILRPGALSFKQLVRVRGVNGNLIGLDFRPADRKLYALSDADIVYTINLDNNLGAATQVSTVSPGFDGGFQSLMDFNPVANALRLIGSNDQNYALVNSNGGNLNATAVQTAMNYRAGDVNAGRNPSISAGSYTNNNNGAQVTIFYAIDSARDTFVTIDPPATGGSSATATGALRTIGRLVTPRGELINFSPTGDFDIFTIAGNNFIVGVSGARLFTIGLDQINPNQALGTTKKVVVRSIPLFGPSGFIDVAIPTF